MSPTVLVAIVLNAIPILAIVGATAVFAYGRAQEQRFKERKSLADELQARTKLLEQNTALRTEFEDWAKTEANGGAPVFLSGTGGASLGQQEAFEAVRGSTNGAYDYLLLAEPNNDSRRRYLDAVASLPGWTQKVIEETFPLLPGFQDRTPGVTLDPDFLPYWEPDLRRTIRERWLPAIRRHDKPRYLKVKASMGGSGVTPLVGIEEFKREYSDVPIYMEVVLDEGDARRTTNIPELLQLYSQVADGICLLENRRKPWLSDQGLALLGPSMITGPWFDRRAPEDFNVLGDLYRHSQFSTLRVSSKTVKVDCRPAWRNQRPPLYYTPTSLLESKLIQAILDLVNSPSTQSVPLPVAELTAIYCIGPFCPDPDLTNLAPRVQDAVHSRLGFNTKLIFASIGKPLSPHTEEVAIAAVGLCPLRADLSDVIAYVTGNGPVDPTFVTPPSITTLGGGNHHAGPAAAAADLAGTRPY